MNASKLVLITGDGLEHHFVANHLAEKLPLTAIVVDHGKPSGLAEKIRKYFRRYTVGQLCSRACLALLRRTWRVKANRRQALLSLFGAENCLEFLRPDLLHHVHGINTPEGVSCVSSLQPDVILVYGTGVVGGKVLSLARCAALNMHTGISPTYRGSDCAFWPVYNEDLGMLGATVHECTKALDGGKIFGTTRVQLQADDNLNSIFGRCVIAGAKLYAEKVSEVIEHGAVGAPQDLSQGVEYKAHMRGVLAELRVRRSIRQGLIRRFVESRQFAERKRSGSGDLAAELRSKEIEPDAEVYRSVTNR